MSDGGGTGITTLTVLQSMAQARQKWGENKAAAISDTAIVKIILGGESNSRDLQDLSTLIGERDETTDSTTTDPGGGRSHQRSIRRVPILPPDALRTMPFGLGAILLRAAPPIVTDLRPWTSRKETSQSINGFIASDPKITFNDQGQARVYARIGISHFQRNEDGTFTELEPSFHHLIQFGRGAELPAERFRKGGNFLAQGYVREYTHTVDGQEVTDEQFVTNRLAHDPNTTAYTVDRRPRAEREAPGAERDPASRNSTRPAPEQAGVEHDSLGR